MIFIGKGMKNIVFTNIIDKFYKKVYGLLI